VEKVLAGNNEFDYAKVANDYRDVLAVKLEFLYEKRASMSTNIYRITESTYKPLRVCTYDIGVVVNPVGSVVLLYKFFLLVLVDGLDKTHLTKLFGKTQKNLHKWNKRDRMHLWKKTQCHSLTSQKMKQRRL
jgi:hypothetical protein